MPLFFLSNEGNPMSESPVCPLCELRTADSFHHIYPKSIRLNRKYHYMLPKDVKSRGYRLCRGCHTQIHKHIRDWVLVRDYQAVSDLRRHPEISRYLSYVAKALRCAGEKE